MNYFSNLAVFFIFNNVIFSYITLTLSKLTNIFGDEERLDTEKVLLAVGSVINELSQNCTASVTYLANFAQHMDGVGTQGEDDYSGNNGICCGACFGLMTDFGLYIPLHKDKISQKRILCKASYRCEQKRHTKVITLQSNRYIEKR